MYMYINRVSISFPPENITADQALCTRETNKERHLSAQFFGG